MRVQGDGVKAHLEDIGGELYIETTGSDVTVDRAGSVTVKSSSGNVSGAITLDLDGGNADISWASLSGSKDSRLTNKTGSITVGFPATGACRVEAKSLYGRIDSDLPAVNVTDDRRDAQGPFNGGSRPVIHITANGDIQLSHGSGSQSAN